MEHSTLPFETFSTVFDGLAESIVRSILWIQFGWPTVVLLEKIYHVECLFEKHLQTNATKEGTRQMLFVFTRNLELLVCSISASILSLPGSWSVYPWKGRLSGWGGGG